MTQDSRQRSDVGQQDEPPHPAEESREVARYEEPVAQISRTNETAAAVMGARMEAEIKARTLVAVNRPRSIERFRQNVLQACKRSRFAEIARYAKPVGGEKRARGFSIRFAEECARQYGNLEISSFIVSEDEERRVVKVVAVDMESNNGFAVDVVVVKTVERRNPRAGDEKVRQRTNSRGEVVWIIRADDDALLVKQNAMIAKAQREVILKHIPSDIREECEDAIAETLSTEERKDPLAARKRCLDQFFRVGVMAEQLREFLGHPVGEATAAELFVLREIFTAISEEGATWADVMAEKRKTSGVADPVAGEATTSTGKGAAAKLAEAVRPRGAAAKEASPKVPDRCGICGAEKGGKHNPECPQFADE